jgi:hypothetical protein
MVPYYTRYQRRRSYIETLRFVAREVKIFSHPAQLYPDKRRQNRFQNGQINGLFKGMINLLNNFAVISIVFQYQGHLEGKKTKTPGPDGISDSAAI